MFCETALPVQVPRAAVHAAADFRVSRPGLFPGGKSRADRNTPLSLLKVNNEEDLPMSLLAPFPPIPNPVTRHAASLRYLVCKHFILCQVS